MLLVLRLSSKGEMPEAEPRLAMSQRKQDRKQGPDQPRKQVCEAGNIPWDKYIYIGKLR